MKSFSAAILLAISLSGCSSGPSLEEQARQAEVNDLKTGVCAVVEIVGKDSITTSDLRDAFNFETDESAAITKIVKWQEDVDALERLVGKIVDPEDGTGWLEFCGLD